MEAIDLGPAASPALDDILGYINFSSGVPDPQFQRRLNEVFGIIQSRQKDRDQDWLQLRAILESHLTTVHGNSPAFANIDQASKVLGLVFDDALPAYRVHHRDLLFHQPDGVLFQPFFIARVFEAVLQRGSIWDDKQHLIEATLTQLNDFLGHRPVAVLESDQKIEPYLHERVRPVPLYLRGAGVAVGQYSQLIDGALEILNNTGSDLLDATYFDLEMLDELAFDPRAYDFEHPANKRPNYHFGQWDPHHIDRHGHYRRFVVTQVTLDALMERVQQTDGSRAEEELLYEAGAVLAGVILMAAGISGLGPDTHDSDTTLTTLLMKIAQTRDKFYTRLINQVPATHEKRLKAELDQLKQPFGAARQHLNQSLARRRALQLQHVHLAQLYARMGYPEASKRQVAIVPVTSARMTCQIDCEIAAGHQSLGRSDLQAASEANHNVRDLLTRAIECGALVDPWNVLGFGGQFSLFPAVENSVHDHRVDHLILLMERIFELHVRTLTEAAAVGDGVVVRQQSDELEDLAQWWDQFATLEMGDVESFSGHEAWESGVHVARALRAWHQAGAAAGDIGFWRQHVEHFESPKAFALSVQALLDKHDHTAAMGLLMQWISEADALPLVEGTFSFHELALRWMNEMHGPVDSAVEVKSAPRPADFGGGQLSSKFLDYLEANAGEYWDVPDLELGEAFFASEVEDLFDDEEDDEDHEENELFSAAYEDVTYRDSTGDGFESDLAESGETETDYELDYESARLRDRLTFLTTLARLWKLATVGILQDRQTGDPCESEDGDNGKDCGELIRQWLDRADVNNALLSELLTAVSRFKLDPPSGTRESMLEFDRRRLVKLSLVDAIIATLVETNDAARLLLAASVGSEVDTVRADDPLWNQLALWQQQCVFLLRDMLHGDVDRARKRFPEVLKGLRERTLLYVPVSRGGDATRAVAAQNLLQLLRQLLRGLPRLGLIRETCQLLTAIPDMERRQPVGTGAVTEYDRLFSIGYKALVESMVRVADGAAGASAASDSDLVDIIERLTERSMRQWLHHSRSLRLSVLEPLADEDQWRNLVGFIKRYGSDLFTQEFLHLGNLRAILHQGVANNLKAREVDPSLTPRFKLLDDLDSGIPTEVAAKHVETVLEAVVENYAEYRDYNTTTTQSDHGDMIYVLLDFLRLKASYLRVEWKIRPIVLAHEILVRCGRNRAAAKWRAATNERTAEVADEHEKQLNQLVTKHAARLATVADRIRERFIRPLDVARARALIEPAFREAREGHSTAKIEMLELELREFTETPTGSGLDSPDWLRAMESELERTEAKRRRPWSWDAGVPFPRTSVGFSDLEMQVDRWIEEDSRKKDSK